MLHKIFWLDTLDNNGRRYKVNFYENEQEKLINRVLDYIEKNLNESLSLERLAAVSTYSAYHFQRTFKGVVGETPAGYVKRLRLENAAHFLIYDPHMPVTEIAIMCGFSSLSYFTYSFNDYFNTSPKKWREGAYLERFPREYYDSKKSKLVSKNQQEDYAARDYNEFKWLDLDQVRIMEFPVCATVKKQRFGPYHEGIPDVWEELFHWSNSRGLIKADTLMFGVPTSNPYITPPEKSRYECRVEVTEEDLANVYNDLVTLFKGGKHVVYEFDEYVDYSERGKLIECYSELYSFWLPRSGYKYLGNPVELVHFEKEEKSLDLTCKIKAIALAVEPK
jgi:AraC family transcriptional regulator